MDSVQSSELHSPRRREKQQAEMSAFVGRRGKCRVLEIGSWKEACIGEVAISVLPHRDDH
jgi:uncharacterized protein (UPF0303 family)